MTKVNEIKKVGKLSKETYIYEIYKLGNMSYKIECNGRRNANVFASEQECIDIINDMVEI